MWEQIRANQRRSVMLITVIAAILLGLGYVIGMYVEPNSGSWFGLVAAVALLVVLWTVAVVGGGDILLGSANAREIQHDDAPQLFNIVEEMTIASGLPKTPRVYIIDTDAPNAFSVGTP